MGIFRYALDELRAIATNRGAFMVLGIAALLYAFFYPLPYMPQVAREMPVVVVDQDRSAMSRQLIRMADAADQVDVVDIVHSEREAEQRLLLGKAYGVFVIPANFERDILRGERVIVGIYGDASYFLVYSQIAMGLAQATGTMSAGIEIRRLQASGYGESAAYDRRDPLPLQVFPLYNETGGYGDYVVPAVLILILQQTLLVGIGVLGGSRREDEDDTTIAPAGQRFRPNLRRAWQNTQMMLGRALAYIGIYSIHIAIYLLVVYRVFDFPQRGNIADIYVFLLPFLLAVIFMGMALASLFRERETAIQILLFSSLPAVFISGFSWPPEALPRWLHTLAATLPSTAGIDGYLRLNQLGATLYQVKGTWMHLWALAGVYFVLALVLIAIRPSVGRGVTEAGPRVPPPA